MDTLLDTKERRVREYIGNVTIDDVLMNVWGLHNGDRFMSTFDGNVPHSVWSGGEIETRFKSYKEGPGSIDDSDFLMPNECRDL